MEESIRRDLKFDDVEGTACLPNDTIFAELARMGSTMASAIICLANNQKFNFSKYIFDNMVKHLEGGVKFLMFLRFLQVFLDKQVEGMAKHKEIYVISSHTKKIIAIMRRQGHGFFRNVTPLFETMMKKIKPKRKQRQSAEDHSPSSEIPVEKKKMRKSRPAGLRRLKKVGLRKQVESSEEKDSLGAQEDASKQGSSIEDIDQDAKIALVDEYQGRMHDADMFGIDDLEGNEVIVDLREKIVKKEVSTADPVTAAGEVVTAASVEDSVAPTTTTIADVDDELSLAKTLIAIKAAKPKVISTAITTPRAKGIVFYEQVQAHIPTNSSSKDKGKAKMIELKKPLKKKDQIALDEEVVRKLEVEMRAVMEEEERIAKEKDDANRARVNTFVDMDTKNMEESLKKTQEEGSSKRARQELKQEGTKKQKQVEQELAKVAHDNTVELKRCLEIVPEDDDVAIEARPLSSKSPTIVNYKIYKEGKKSYFKIIRAEGNSQNYLTFGTMFKNFNREDLKVLRSIVKERFKKTKPVNDMKNLLF
nr:hypothetical protein [Tanacetum cinerariifolium]